AAGASPPAPAGPPPRSLPSAWRGPDTAHSTLVPPASRSYTDVLHVRQNQKSSGRGGAKTSLCPLPRGPKVPPQDTTTAP
ncbi:unnamed protein product, partial [Gulo gulo]